MSRREMKADVFDYLELAALAYGGIGREAFYAYDLVELRDDRNCPVCVHGIGFASDEINLVDENEVTRELSRLGITYKTNDGAVYEINQRLGRDPDTRVTWPRYRKHLGIVRAEVTNA